MFIKHPPKPCVFSSAIAILGAGSWGTALAIHLALKGQIVHLWGDKSDHMEILQASRFNPNYLSNIRLPSLISCFSDLAKAIENVTDILIAVPSAAFDIILQKLKPLFTNNQHLLWASKGLCKKQWLHQVIQTILGDIPSAVLSGPTFASEIARGLPSLAIIASSCKNLAQKLCDRFQSQYFRISPSQDVMGVELAGAMKNIFAIAVGILEGLGMKANTQSALMTNGLSEIIKLGLALGCQFETFLGSAGIGDLILTCTNNQSRNRRFGLAIGRGETIQKAQQSIDQTIEGVETSSAIIQHAIQHKIQLPICTRVYQILYEAYSPQTLLDALLQ
ncbi:NAD(P)H-dependent glycerol-3-phosphate dehydrogenase [Candidatus Cardinium hertigii]|jgi:glycerol-3-phosphate dehydrogenase (NAD(P)+)|uniref:Glycerol-3-phosphate dehydrogenase [NAD(P)+] n=1 Tax=Candidatus Cardinium hertigii TaxID=247481 RepID=A0A3N2QCP1_9BACT|nr:NAD(P)H-dependent glycerol-3-phosphate dehydrogenase [Candidatus Cardinium hertigii]ROT47513.1 NAD(P)-dependent glycerol-3-phosphate dehydrogenase [Candidatus Cardinium hertigii]ROT47547.1 NAD(P)-dependent glycerol-3-phosphate dehydrogenase [Candidatus Cardinium hertigii]